MPALQVANELIPRDGVGLDPHGAEPESLTARQPSMKSPYDSPIVADALSGRSIQARQVTTGIIPTYYTVDGPAPGAVIGLVLGSVAGFILIVGLLYSLTNGQNGRSRGAIQGEEEIVVRRPRRNSHGGRSRRSSRPEVREYSRSPRRSGTRSQVIVEERRGPRPRSVVVESRVPGDDVVEVIEEHDEYRARRGSRRGGYR